MTISFALRYAMPLSDDQLTNLTALARLAPPEAPAALRDDLEQILAYVQRLAAHDDPAVAPLRHPNLPGDAVEPESLRSDEVGVGLTPDELAALAPSWREGRIEVPRTVEHD
jgi:aspartyl/glutamyl-tRNA(Asn/Gln) amidotransferase C subunit